MAKSHMGARVMFCGHDGWFVADIIKIGTANVVRASEPVRGSNIIREDLESATHRVVDFPNAGFWRPELGIFVVPEEQVQKLSPGVLKSNIRKATLGKVTWTSRKKKGRGD